MATKKAPRKKAPARRPSHSKPAARRPDDKALKAAMAALEPIARLRRAGRPLPQVLAELALQNPQNGLDVLRGRVVGSGQCRKPRLTRDAAAKHFVATYLALST